MDLVQFVESVRRFVFCLINVICEIRQTNRNARVTIGTLVVNPTLNNIVFIGSQLDYHIEIFKPCHI